MSQYQSLQDIVDAGKLSAHGYIVEPDMGVFGLIKVRVSLADVLKRPKFRRIIKSNTPLTVRINYAPISKVKRAKDIYLQKDDAVAEMKRLGLYKKNRKELSHGHSHR